MAIQEIERQRAERICEIRAALRNRPVTLTIPRLALESNVPVTSLQTFLYSSGSMSGEKIGRLEVALERLGILK